MNYKDVEWEIDYDNSDERSGGQWYDVGPARIMFPYGASESERDKASEHAKLISKAPKMYEALKKALVNNRNLGFIDCVNVNLIESLLKEIDNGQ